jgi:hypothetical protein
LDNKLKYRYPGAQPFLSDQKDIFYGRTKAIQSFYNQLSFEDLILLHSKSGLGKSSLINAGLMPMIENEGVYQAINIRLNVYSGNPQDTPLKITRQKILNEFDKPCFLNKIYPDDNSLWYALKKRQITGDESKTFLLVFDQFEELFTYPEASIFQFARQFSEILFSEIPQRVRKMVELFTTAQPDILSEEEQDLLFKRLKVKIILSIRSDRLSLLEKLNEYIPNILNKRFELKSLNRGEAESAMIEPAHKKGSFISPQFDYDAAAIENILSYLTKGHTKKIETFQLQILCHSLEQRVLKEALSKITIKETKNLDHVFENYYDDKINLIGTDAEVLVARTLLEETLIFEDEQRRLSLYEGQLYQLPGVTPELLNKLIDSRLLRAEPSIKGGYTYELSHDTLVLPVLKAKSKRKEEEKKVEAEKIRLVREQELSVARKKRQRARQLAIFMSLLAVVSLFASGFAIIQFREAKKERIAAEEARETAENAFEALQKEVNQRKLLEIEKLLSSADDFIKSEDYDLAMDYLNAAYNIDSTNQSVIQLRNEIKSFLDQ